jgi:hypothetical protein
MRVLVLTTSARISQAWVDELVESLPVDDVDLRLVALTRPAERLAVGRCLVVGPSLRPFRTVRDLPAAGARGAKPAKPGRVAKSLDKVLARTLPAGRRKDRRVMLMTGTRWSRIVREEFAAADLVVAHDYNTTWAAWRLARAIAGPEVVFQVEGAALKLAELAERGRTG